MPRPRKPVALHQIEGTYRRHRHTDRREVEAHGELPEQPPPPHLTTGERIVWLEACQIAPPRLLKSADAFVLEALIAAVTAHRVAREALATAPLLIEGSESLIVHPLTREIRQQARLVADLAAKLGMTPSSRLQLLDGIQSEADPTDPEFLRMFGPLKLIKGGR